MSKLSFRARALDATKPLPVYHADEIPDLSEYNTINRTVPQMPTGMEKEEEGERHLQEVILAQQTNSVKKQLVYIPTPDASIGVQQYEEIAKPIQRASQYIRVPGLGLEEEVPDYDLDSEDDEWLSVQTNERPLSPTHFERMMDKLEKGSGNTVLSEKEAQFLLRDDEDLVLAVYDYWLAKRLRLGRSLIPTVKNISKDGTSSSGNPYLAFRKRMEKMQTRKNRKNDETAYMQMLKLKRDLEKALSLAELVKERESKKNTLAQNQMNIFKKRYILEDWSGSIMSSLRPVATRSATSKQSSTVSDDQWNSRTVFIKMDSSDDYDVHTCRVGRHEVLVSSGLKKKRKKKYYYPDAVIETPIVPPTPDKDTSRELLSEKLEDDEPDGIFTFKRKPHVKYHHSRSPIGVWPWQLNLEPSPLVVDEERRGLSWSQSKRYRFSRVSCSGHSFNGLARRRVGRGGRVLWDRVQYPDDESKLDNQDELLLKEKHDTTPRLLESQGTPTAGLSRHEPADKKAPATEKEETNASTSQQLHRLHFEGRSPSPSTKFEFQPLHLIEHTDHNSPPNIIPFGSAPGNYHEAGEFRLGRLPSSSEGREEALSFSTLPTSQFALKPSTFDMGFSDYQYAPFSQTPLEPYSWSWLRNSRLHLGNIRRTNSDPSMVSAGSDGGSNTTGHPSSSAPGNYHQIGLSSSGSGGSGAFGTSSSQQAPGSSLSSSVASSKVISRSSLSVTSSKTIILSNAPVSHAPPPHPPPPPTATGNPALTNAGNTATKTSSTMAPPTDTPTSKGEVASQSNTPTPQQPSTQRQPSVGGVSSNIKTVPPIARRKSDPPPSVPPQQISGGQPATKTEAKEQVAESKPFSNPSQIDDTPTTTGADGNNHDNNNNASSKSNQNSAESAFVKTPPTGDVTSKESSLKPASDADASTTPSEEEPMDTSSLESKGPAESANSQPKVDNPKLSSSDSKAPGASNGEDASNLNKSLDAWMVNKPPATVLQLSRPRKRDLNKRDEDDDNNLNSPKTKHRRTLYASAEAALLITSQFSRPTVKKEELAPSQQPLTVTHALNSAVVGMGSRNTLANMAAAGLPISNSMSLSETNAVPIPHSGVAVAKIPLPVATTPTLSLPQNTAKLLSLETVHSLHQQHQQVQAQAVVNSVQDGVAHLSAGSLGHDKKTVVNAVSASGQAQALPGNLAVRRSSTGTNGTNSYLHSERVKQALAGMNHNSLLESTKNALVPMNKSSEVT